MANGVDIYKINGPNGNLERIARAIEGHDPSDAKQALGHRVRVAQARSLFASRFAYDEQPILFNDVENVNGNLIYTGTKDSVSLQIGTAQGDKFIRSTNEYFHYQSYRDTISTFGILYPEFQQGQRARGGMFDEDNGAYLERDENGDLYCVRRSSAGDSFLNGNNEERIAQADWNFDTMLGDTGNGIDYKRNPSGITLDIETIQMVGIVLSWYGAGFIDVLIKIDNVYHQIHRFKAGNRMKAPIVGEPTLPIRFEIENITAVSEVRSLEYFGVACSADSGGDLEDKGFEFSASNKQNGVSVSDTNYTRVLTIRPKATFKGKTNRVKIEPLNFAVFATGKNMSFVLVRDAPLSGTESWNNVSVDSATEYAIAPGTLTLTGGYTKDYAYAPAGAGSAGGGEFTTDPRNPLVVDASGSQTVNLSLFARSLSAGTGTAYASIRWKEIQ